MPLKQIYRLLPRLEAVFLAALTLWAVHITAGSQSAAAALSALEEAAASAALRHTLLSPPEQLSPAAALVLNQSPVLIAEKSRVMEHWNDSGIHNDAKEEETSSLPDRPPADDSKTAQQPTEHPEIDSPVQEENGSIAKTLIPSGPDGFFVCGRVYIKNSTQYSLSTDMLREPFDAKLTSEAPQLLIIHSHGSEAYTPAPGTEVVWSGDHRTTDSRWSVVKAGDEMASVFGDAGITVIHDRTLYDYPNYTGSYDRSMAAIRSYLAQYPSIRFILDVHRDAIEDAEGNQYKVVSTIDGAGTAAQLALVMGSDGSGLEHPNWRENLKLAVAIQEQILSEYPTLMRPITLRNSRYNQNATTGTLLVEVGAAGNSPEEARLAARLFAEQMAKTLQDQSK